MSRRYTPEEKAEALVILQNNACNIAMTSLQTGIPQRTLRDWKRERDLDGLSPLPPPQGGYSMAAANARHEPIADDPPPEFDQVEDALEYVQEQIVQELVEIAHSLKHTLRSASPYHRILAFNHLTDRVEKLRNLIPKTASSQTFRVEFVDPFTGETGSDPYWERNRTNDDEDDDGD